MKLASHSPSSTASTGFGWLVLGALLLCATTGALNGNNALTASVWDSLQAWLQSMLTSTWVLVLAFIALIAAVWTLAHGGGYRGLSLILGILAVALIGPGVVTSIATANGEVASISAPSGSFSKLPSKL